MPIYEYEAVDKDKSCGYCRNGFSELQSLKDKPFSECPDCGNEVRKIISAVFSSTREKNLDKRAKKHGFTKLVKEDKGKYRKLY